MSAPAVARPLPAVVGRVPVRVLLVAAGLVILGLLPLFGLPRYLVTVLTEVFIYAMFAMSLDLLMGYTGLPSLGHAAFWGIGGYAAGIVAIRYSPDAWLAIPAAVVASGIGAAIIGALSIRTSGVYFLMLTLAFSQMVFAAAFKWTPITGGSNGLSGIPRLVVPGLDLGDGPTYYYVAMVALVATLLLLWTIVRSPLGRTFIGIRENEARMRALGYDTWLYKLASFLIAGMLAGFAGALYVGYSLFASPGNVHWTTSGLVMIMVIVGGTGTLVGPALGAALELLLRNWVSSLPGIGDRWQLIMGAVFVGFVLFARGGLVGIFESASSRFRSRPDTAIAPVAIPAPREEAATGELKA